MTEGPDFLTRMLYPKPVKRRKASRAIQDSFEAQRFRDLVAIHAEEILRAHEAANGPHFGRCRCAGCLRRQSA